jgi:hypothetical protein
MDGFDGPLLDPVVFEHLVEISTNCLLTPVQLNTLTLLGEDWKATHEELVGINFDMAKGAGGREYRGGNPMYQMLSNRQSLVENKQHNQIPMYTYFQPVYTAITFEFVGTQGYQEALLMLDDYLQFDAEELVVMSQDQLSERFTQVERDALYGQPPSVIMWKKLQKEKVTRCYPTPEAVTVVTQNNKPYKRYDATKYACATHPRGTEAEILQAIRGLVAVETNLQLFGGTDIQSFVPNERLPTIGRIIGDTRALCAGTKSTTSSQFLGFKDLCLLKTAFCPFDQQADFSGLSNRQILTVFESAYFAGSDAWRGNFNLNATQAFGLPQDTVFYPESFSLLSDDNATLKAHASMNPCPASSDGASCSLNWRRKKVVGPNALETGVFGAPLRKADQTSITGWKMAPKSSNFDLAIPPGQPLSLAEYCTALAENRFKGTVRGQPGSKINREDNTLCNFRAALLVDFFQNLSVNTFLNHFGPVNVDPFGMASTSASFIPGAFGDLSSGGGNYAGGVGVGDFGSNGF